MPYPALWEDLESRAPNLVPDTIIEQFLRPLKGGSYFLDPPRGLGEGRDSKLVSGKRKLSL